ncbi:MAG: multifunctional CCA addition/repair protein, partial [Gammaproteobacteria bacterium]
AETKPEILPSHPGHEVRSARLAAEFCARFRAPAEVRDLAILVAEYHVKIHRVAELRPNSLLELLENLDAFRRPARIADILLACQCDALGRGFSIPNDYPSAAYIPAALEAARTVDMNAIVAATGGGAAVKAALREARLATVTAFVKRTRSES